MLKTTIGQLLINNALPKELRDYSGNIKLDKKGTEALLAQVAERYPDQYRDVAQKLSDVGRSASQFTGGNSFGLKALLPSESGKAIREDLKSRVKAIYADRDIDDATRDKRVVELLQGAQQKLMDAVYDDGVADGNPLTRQLIGAGRGNKFSLNSLRGADLLYADHRGNTIPIPILRNYSEGLRPVEYFGGAFGARKGLVDLKCLDGETPVVMADWSVKAIRRVRVGDRVMGSDTLGRLRPVRVLTVFDNGLRPCRKWTFRVGACQTRYVDLIATDDHKILAQIKAGRPGSTYAYRSSYTPAALPLKAAKPQRNARKNTFVAWPGRGEELDVAGRVEPRALLLGLLLGDGYMPVGRTCSLSCGDPVLIEDTATYLASLNLWLRPPTAGYSYTLREIVPTKQRMEVRNGRNCYAGTTNPIKLWLKSVGAIGSLAPDKSLPADVWSWDRNSICDLIAGLIATDGTVEARPNGCTIKLKLTSRSIVADVQRLLELRLGIWGTPIRRLPAETIPLANHDQWEITVSHPEAIRRFAELIRLPGVKRHQLAAAMSRLSSQPRSLEMGFKLDHVEPAGDRRTFDIEVDHPDHLFLLGNGLVVSNSATQDAGFFSKQLTQATHRLLVTALDDDNPYDEASPRGFPTSAFDNSNVNALLAHPVGGYARNTLLTPRVLKDLQARDIDDILVRSPMVGGPEDGGVFGRDVGKRERGTISPDGDWVGLAGAHAVGEPITQAQICLGAGTPVRMADWSIRAVETVAAGEMVMGADRDGRLFPVKVLRRYDNGVRECIRTVFRVGKTQERIELTSTPEHKILGKVRRWARPHEVVERGILPVGTKCTGLSARMPHSVQNPGGRSEPFAQLIGLLLGDGCYTPSVKGVHWSCYEPDLVAAVAPYLATLQLQATKLRGHVGYYRISQLAGTPYAARNAAKGWLQHRGMYGKYAHEKTIPDEVWEWDQASVAALIGGLWATGGSVYSVRTDANGPHISFGSTSFALASLVRELLRVRFAVFGSDITANGTGRKRALWGFQISRPQQVRKFAANIPVPGRKGRMLDELLRSPDVDTGHDYFHRIKAATGPVGRLPTFDLEVDHPDHLFVLANGLIVSNSSKHSGGVAGAGAAQAGFPAINRMVQVPEIFQGGATHAQLDGKVTAVEAAPQGGTFVTVDGKRHYVKPDRKVTVKPGDEIEAGDALSDGMLNPAELVEHKGVGEGRRYFVSEFGKTLDASNAKAERRNIELLARGLINHVRLTDELDEWSPDDIVPYQLLERRWKPREGATSADPSKLAGQYLEKPVLHYSIGTKLRPSVLKELQKFKVPAVTAHKDPLPFAPEMVRGMETVSKDQDWMTRFLGSYQQKSLLRGVAEGASSDLLSTSYVPALATGETFGRRGPTKGWQPNVPVQPQPAQPAPVEPPRFVEPPDPPAAKPPANFGSALKSLWA